VATGRVRIYKKQRCTILSRVPVIRGGSISVKNILLLCAVVIVVTIPGILLSADISGDWVVEQVDKKGVVTKTILEFYVEGNKVTGSMLGYLEDEWPLLDGRISGDKISFTVKENIGRRTNTNLYIGKIKGDIIEFSSTPINAGHGIPPRFKFTAKRVVP
jgi:hypothetical protein